MAINDIEGARPRVKRVFAQRNNYRLDDIDGARPKPPISRKEPHD